MVMINTNIAPGPEVEVAAKREFEAQYGDSLKWEEQHSTIKALWYVYVTCINDQFPSR